VVTTISFFKYNTNKFWAFKQMYLAFELMNKVSDLVFLNYLEQELEQGSVFTLTLALIQYFVYGKID